MANYVITMLTTLIVCILFYLVVMMFFNNRNEYKNKEGFHNLSPGEYPLTVDKLLLYGDYNVQNPPYLSAFNASDIYKEYPVFPAHSTKINNIRYWTKPENGKCSRAELCGYFYEDYTKQNIPPRPPVPGWNKRINYYVEDY